MSVPPTHRAEVEAAPGIDPAVWRTAFTIVAGAMAVVFDATIVSLAINPLAQGFNASIATVQWVNAGYLLAMFVTIPLVGWGQSLMGGKKLWIFALGMFLLGSILCACAWSVGSLIVFRVLQGLAGGVMMPLMMTLIIQAAGGRNLGAVMSIITLPASLGPILGPVLGGIILSFGNWRWLFLVNIPFCAVGAYLAFRNLPTDDPSPRAPLDWISLSLLSPGIAAIIFGLSRVGPAGGFGARQVLVSLLLGCLLVAAFVRWARSRGSDALVDIGLLRHPPLASASVLGFLAGAGLYGALLLMPLYWQQLRGESPFHVGLLLIPQGVGTLVARAVAGRLTDEVGARRVGLAGFAIVAAATIPFGFVTQYTSNILLLAALFVRGVGMGAATIAFNGAAYVGLPREDVPSASIITRVVQQIGGSMGTAVLAVILFSASSKSGGSVPAFREAFWWSVAFAAAAIPACFFLPGRSAARRT